MTKGWKFKASIGVLFAVAVGLMEFIPTIIYKETIDKLDAIPGVDVKWQNRGFKEAFIHDYRSAITIHPDASSIISTVSDNHDLKIHTITAQTDWYNPFSQTTYSFLTGRSAKLVTEKLKISTSKDEKFYLPIQISTKVVNPFTQNFEVLALTDHIKYGDLVDLGSIAIHYSQNGHFGYADVLAPSLKFTNSNNKGGLEIKTLKYSWGGKVDGCKDICDGSSNIYFADVTQYDRNDSLSLKIEHLDLDSQIKLLGDHYQFNFSASAKSIENSFIYWQDIGLNTSLDNVKVAALKSFDEGLKNTIKGNSLPLMSSNMEELYAHLLESGLTLDLIGFHAKSDNGPLDAELHINFPEDKMPNMATNPLGVINVIEGNAEVSFPSEEVDRIFGVGSASAVAANHFGMIDDSILKSKIKVKDGHLEVLGRQISL